MKNHDTLNNKKTMYLVDIISDGDAGERHFTTHIYPTTTKTGTKVKGKQVALSVTESDDSGEDIKTVGRFTRTDADVMIHQLRTAFDIASDEQQIIQVLQNQLEAAQSLIESLSSVTIANIMYENGLRTAVLTPSRIVSGLTPAMDIDATRPDEIKYTLKEAPLNV